MLKHYTYPTLSYPFKQILTNMPGISYPIPVRYCEFSGEHHHRDTTGFYSLDYDCWFSNITCYYQYALSMGNPCVKNFQDVLMKQRETIYKPNVIRSRKERFREQVRAGMYKVIKRTHAREDIVSQD